MKTLNLTKLQQVRRYITKYFKNIYDGGFIFLCKIKEILKSEESKLTVFDILPKIPAITNNELPRQCFQYPDVQYKKIWYNYDGKRYSIRCACVIFLFERSKVSHWPPEVLREVLGASTIEGFSYIPTDIVSWSGKLVECRGTPLHIHAALGQKGELSTAIHQLPDGTTAKCLTDQRGATPLHYAAANGNLDICEIIVAGIGSEMIYHTDNLNRSPLHCALYKRQAPTITYLIQMNADIDTPDDTGNNCLDLLFKQKPKDIEFIVSKLETDCVDNRVQFSLMYLSMEDKKFAHVRQLANSITSVSDFNIGTSLLHLTALLKLTDVTTILVNKGFDNSKRDITEFLPFHIACISGATDQIRILMYPEMEDADVNKGIQLCIRYGHISGCDEILGFRPIIALEETTVCVVMQTLNTLLRKLRHKSTDEEPLKHFENIARMLLPMLKTIPDVLNTFVFDCAMYGASETLILLKSLGGNFNACDFSGRSPLHEAAQSNKLRCTRVLLKGGSNPNAVDWRGSTALHYACATGNTNIVKCLMENRQIKANIRDVNGRTPLLIAAYFCKNDVVCYLLRCCNQLVDLTVVDSHGYGILHFSVHLKENTVDLIVENLSRKPKSLPDEDGYRSTEKIPDGSWIAEIRYTDFQAHTNEDEMPSGNTFSMKRDESSTLWTKRTQDGPGSRRKIVKSPKRVYEQCGGCGFLLKPSLKHNCKSPSDRKKKKVKLRAFLMHDRGNKETTELSPFFLSVKSGNISIMKKLRKLDTKSSAYRDSYGRNCLYLAIDLKSLKIVKTVMELVPDIEKAGAIRRIVNAPMGDKRDSTQLSLLTYMISNGYHISETKHHSNIIEIAIEKKNSDVIRLLVDKVNIISDETMALAVDSGSVDILDPVLKKWRKNKDRKLNEFNLLTVACCSKNLSVAVVNQLLPLYRRAKEHAAITAIEKEDNNFFTQLCQSLRIKVVPKYTLLGKFLYKNHPALKTKPPVSIEVFQKIGTLLLNETELVLENTNNSHATCECLADCIEMKCFTLVEPIVRKSTDTMWNCEFSDTPCHHQRHFQKNMYSYVAKQMRRVSYLQNLILVAVKTKVPENILAMILKYGVKFFKSDVGKESSVDIDIFSEENQKIIGDSDDNMTKLILTVLELISGEKTRVFDVLRLWKNVPGVLTYSYLLSREIDTRPFIKKKDECFLNNCYTLFLRKGLPLGTTVLHVAAGNHDTPVLKILIKASAPIDCNVENKDGVSPLDMAVACGSWHNYKLLTDNRGEVDAKLLEECCMKGSVNVRKILRLTNPSYDDGNHNKSRFKVVQDIWSRLETKHSRALLQEVNLDMLKESAKNKLWEVDDYFLENAHQLVTHQFNKDKEYIRFVCISSPTTLMLKHLDNIEKHSKSFTDAAIAEVTLQLTVRNEDTICNHLITKTMTSISEETYHAILYYKDKHNEYNTVLHYAAKNGNIRVLQHFVRKSSTEESPLNLLDSSKATPFWYAASNRHWKCAQCLLIAGCCPICPRAIPDFDSKRRFTSASKKLTEKNFIPHHWSNDDKIQFGKRLYRSNVNNSANVAYSLGKKRGNVFQLKKQSHSNFKKKDNLAQRVVVKRTERSIDYKKTLELVQLATVASHNGGDLIHVAYAQGNQEIVSQILAFDRSSYSAQDKDGITPTIYALINGNIALVRQKDETNQIETLQALVWRFMSTETLQKRLVYAITQVLTYTCWRYAPSLEEKPFTVKTGYSRHFNEIYEKHRYPQSFPKGPQAYESGMLYSLEHFSNTIEDIKTMLGKFYGKPVVKEFIALFQYLPCGTYTKRYNKYSSVSPTYYDQIQHQTIIEKMKEEIASMKVEEVPREIWTALLLSGESWVMQTLVELSEKVENFTLTNPFLLDLTITDLIPLSVQSEECRDKYIMDKENIENLKRLIKIEPSLTLRSDIVDVARAKDMWSFLEIMGQNTLVESGELNPVWQTVMARAASDGRIDFIKCIVNGLEVSKMTEDQKACFVAFNCLASLNGQLEIVKYLQRNRIPLVGSMNQSPIKDLIGESHVTSWGVLEYAVKGNSPNTVDFLLRCFKDDRNIRNNVNCRTLLELATEIGNLSIFKSICKYMDNIIGMAASREELNKAYKLSLLKGRESLCIHLLEQHSTSLVIYTDDKNSSLHYAAIHEMYLLAERIVTSRPEVIDQLNTDGYTALDYANLLGKVSVAKILVAHKANPSSLSTDKLECYGWFHDHMLKTSDPSPEQQNITHSKKGTALDIVSILESGNDTLASSAINCSGYLIKAQLGNNFSTAIQIFFSAARKGCIKSLMLLCDIIKDNEYLQTKVLSFELKNLTVLASAIANKHKECVKVLLELVVDNGWRNNHTNENILHIAVKTEDMELVQLVDDKTKKALRTEGDKQNLTPIIYSASLGLHHIVAYLTSEIPLETETHQNYHEATSVFEQTCLECVLDLCIGWSKLYQSRDEHKDERNTRPVKVRYNRVRGFYTFDEHYFRHRISDGNKFWPMWPWISSGSRLKLPPSCQIWKSLLFCMGYKEDIGDLEELVLKLSSPKNYTLHQILKKAMPRKDYIDTVIRLSENDEDINDLLLAAAACGNTQFLQHYLKYNVVVDSDNASLSEVAFAFGNTNTAIFLQGKNEVNLDDSYSVFKNLLETLPQRIKWATGLEKPGDDKWENSVQSDPLENQLSMADLWVLADLPRNIIDNISVQIDLSQLVPQAIYGKKYTADIESFKKNELCKHFHAVTLRAYVSSSHIYGRQMQMFTNNENARLKTVQSVKVTCEPTGPGNLPKIHIDPSGNYLETIVLSQTNSCAAIMVDNTLVQKSAENVTRTQIIEMTVPAVLPLVERIFPHHVNVRIDWASLESRRRSGNYDLLLKLLSGDLSGCRSTRLAGLEDVLEQCIEILGDLVDMYDQATADIALQSLSHIREIVVVYVDTLQRPATPRKNKATSMSDILTWEFTFEKSTLIYDRDVFSLFTELMRYHHLAGAVYNAVYRIANLDPKTSAKYIYFKPTEQLTLDIDLKSFGIKNGTMINEKLCQGVGREVDAIARECEAMMLLTMKANRVLLRNSPSVQGAGITYQDSVITISVCTHLNSQKHFTVERAQIRPKLEDLEDQQVLGSWDSDIIDGIKPQCEKLSYSLRKQYGIDVQIIFDEKRITGFAFQRYRREMTHPLTLIGVMMTKCIENISIAIESLVSDIYDSLNGDYVMVVPHSKHVPNGFWTKCPSLSKMNEKPEDIFLVQETSNGRSAQEVHYTVTKGQIHTVRWRRVNFESHLKADKATSIDFVSINNKLYRILEKPSYHRVISQIPLKIHINGEILESIESLGVSVLKEKLSPDFNQTIRDIQSPIKMILVTKDVENELHSLFDIYPEIKVDFAAFTAPIKASVADRETWDCIERMICVESSRLKTSFQNLMSKYKLHEFSTPICPRLSVLQCGMIALLRKIELIQFRYKPESETTKAIKRRNPTISRIHNSIDVLFCSPVISNTNYDEQIRNVLMSFISNMMEVNVLKFICSQLQIGTKRASITTKYSNQKSLDEAVLWCYQLLNKDQDKLMNGNPEKLLNEDPEIQLRKFHKIAIDGAKATFQMKGMSTLEIALSIDEKLRVDEKLFRRICKPSPKKPEMHLSEFDLKFLKYGENLIRINTSNYAAEESDILEPAFYKVELTNKEQSSSELLQPTSCAVKQDNDSVICLRLLIPEKIDKNCEFAMYYKDIKFGRTVECILDTKAQSKEGTPCSTSLQIKKGKWTNIAVHHESSVLNSTIDNDLVAYRLIRANKMIEPLHGYGYVRFVAVYSPSHIFSQTNNIESPIKITLVSKTLQKYRLRILDSQREVKLKAICNQCKQYLKISTPFPEILPPYELFINRQDEETLENNG